MHNIAYSRQTLTVFGFIVMVALGVFSGFIIVSGFGSALTKLMVLGVAGGAVFVATIMSPMLTLSMVLLFGFIPFFAMLEIKGFFQFSIPEILALVLGSVVLFNFLATKRRESFSFLNLYTNIFIAILLVSYLRTPVLPTNFFGLPADEGPGFRASLIFTMIIGFLFSFSLGNIAARKEYMQQFWRIFFWLVAFITMFNLLRFVFNFDLPIFNTLFTWKIHQFTSGAGAATTYRFGILGMYASWIFIGLLSFFPHDWKRWLSILGIGICCFAIVASGGRASLIMSVIGFLAILFIRRHIKKIIGLGFLFFIVLVILYMNFDSLPANVQRIISFLPGQSSEASGSSSWRLLMWESAMNVFREYPIFGIGYNKYIMYTIRYAPWALSIPGFIINIIYGAYHNFYVTVLVTTGLVGFFSFLSVLASYALLAFRLYNDLKDEFYKNILTFAFALLVSRSVAFLFEGVFALDAMFISIGLIVAVKIYLSVAERYSHA